MSKKELSSNAFNDVKITTFLDDKLSIETDKRNCEKAVQRILKNEAIE